MGQYVHLGRALEGDEPVDDDALPVIDAVVTSLSLRHHFGKGWSTSVAIPVGLISMSARAAQTESGAHDSDSLGRVAGFGDLSVGARYDFSALWGPRGYKPSLVLGYTLGLPTGEQATLASAGAGVPPTFLGIGDGSFSGTWQLGLTQFLHPKVALSLPARLRVPFSRSSAARLSGTSFGSGLSALWLVHERVVLRAGLDYEALGYTDEEHEGKLINSGGSWLRAGGGASFRIGEHLVIGASGRAPVLTKVHGRQASESFSVDLSLTVRLGAGKKKHEHGDDDHGGGGHGDGGDHGDGDHGDGDHGNDDRGGDKHGNDRGDDDKHSNDDRGNDHGEQGDVSDLATGGARFDTAKALVVGKVTVIDFWASWCQPCKHIDRTLRKLAANHPKLAVRRVEAPDVDTPVVDQLGGKLELPVVWIFNERGHPVAKLRKTTAAQVSTALKELLDASPADTPANVR